MAASVPVCRPPPPRGPRGCPPAACRSRATPSCRHPTSGRSPSRPSRRCSADGLDLARCTVLVGENGSGKSTLVEALAMAAGMNAEGGSTGATHRTHASESPLHEWLTVVRDPGAPRWGYFVRAETMHGLFTYLDTSRRVAVERDPAFHGLSHGESFVSLLGTRRFRGEGLFVMDEPEAGLSFSAQLHLVAELAEMARRAAHPGRARHPLTGARRHPGGVGARAGRARHPADDVGRPRGGDPPPQLPRRAAALPAARHRRPRRLTADRGPRSPRDRSAHERRYGVHDLLTEQSAMT